MRNKINLLVIFPSLAIILCALYIFYCYAKFVGESAVVYSPYLDAVLGGYGNTIHADVALILGVLIIIMYLINLIETNSLLGRILKFFTSKGFGIIVFIITFITISINVLLIYLKFFDERSATLYKSITGNGYAEIIICVSSIFLLFQNKSKPRNLSSTN